MLVVATTTMVTVNTLLKQFFCYFNFEIEVLNPIPGTSSTGLHGGSKQLINLYGRKCKMAGLQKTKNMYRSVQNSNIARRHTEADCAPTSTSTYKG